jgi:hypothetical protein
MADPCDTTCRLSGLVLRQGASQVAPRSCRFESRMVYRCQFGLFGVDHRNRGAAGGGVEGVTLL